MDTVHLDLGSGRFPRNPFGAKKVYGVDISDVSSVDPNVTIMKADLNFERLPFDVSTFDSISAFDFLEHILRVRAENGRTHFPFVELMSEIFRVLKPGGIFYALTPSYPNESVFVDPTHVNFVSRDTHKYFCSPDNWATMYGYSGSFDVLESRIVNFDTEIKRLSGKPLLRSTFLDSLFKNRCKHVVWKFRAIK